MFSGASKYSVLIEAIWSDILFQNQIRQSLSQAVIKMDTAASEDATYEADIANDMRELELRLQEELEEREDESSK